MVDETAPSLPYLAVLVPAQSTWVWANGQEDENICCYALSLSVSYKELFYFHRLSAISPSSNQISFLTLTLTYKHIGYYLSSAITHIGK